MFIRKHSKHTSLQKYHGTGRVSILLKYRSAVAMSLSSHLPSHPLYSSLQWRRTCVTVGLSRYTLLRAYFRRRNCQIALRAAYRTRRAPRNIDRIKQIGRACINARFYGRSDIYRVARLPRKASAPCSYTTLVHIDFPRPTFIFPTGPRTRARHQTMMTGRLRASRCR